MSRRKARDATMATGESWTCPGCGGTVLSRYCPTCGEGVLRPRDLTLRGLFDQVFEALTSVDGRLIASLRSLLLRPGVLTVAYLQGRRKPFIGPFQLFLIANVVFFAVQSLTGAKIFSTPLAMHLRNQFWTPAAEWMVNRRLEATHTTLEKYAPVFDQAVALHAKSLIVLMVIPFALLPALLFPGKRPAVAHVVFALHFYAFLLLLFCAVLIMVGCVQYLGGPGLDSARADEVLSIVNLLACSGYLWVATKTVYGAGGVSRVIKVVALVVAAAGIVLGYRFVLLPITLYST